ncbi:MAG: sensor histidine kinase [Pseudomonadota bacterium]
MTEPGTTPAAERQGAVGSGFIPQLCHVGALSLLVLIAQLLVIVLWFAGDEFTWIRFALLSLFVQWVALLSAGLICSLRRWLNRLPLVPGALAAFGVVLLVTGTMGYLADRLLRPEQGVDWFAIFGQLVIAAIIAGLALRYFYVQQQLRAQEQAQLKARLQALQSRIRPHFLFNSMNIIASLIAVDPELAETVVEDLSELFRASLNEAGNQVALADELDLCRRYARIETLRLGERLQIDWQLAPHQGVRIPLLTLQPLLENAIYHGVQPLPEGGTIRIELVVDQERVRLTITNPLPPRGTPPSQGNRMALNNIRSRLQVLYGSAARLTAQAEGEQFVTRLQYPVDGPVNAERRSAPEASAS